MNSNDNYLRDSFKKLDENGDGKIDRDELAKIIFADGGNRFDL